MILVIDGRKRKKELRFTTRSLYQVHPHHRTIQLPKKGIYKFPPRTKSTLHSFPRKSNRHHLERNGTPIHLLINAQRRAPPIGRIKSEGIRPRPRTRARHRPGRNLTRELVQAKPSNLVRIPESHGLVLRVAVRHGRELRARRAVVLQGPVREEFEGCRSEGVLVARVEEHVGIAGAVGVGVFVEVDAVVGT